MCMCSNHMRTLIMRIIIAAILILGCFAKHGYVYAQTQNLKGKCSAEAFNGDFLLELVSIPTNISKKLNFSSNQTIRGFRANILCTGRYAYTKVDIISTSQNKSAKQNIIITDENYKLMMQIPVKPNSQTDITKQVCNKVVYVIPGFFKDNGLVGYDNIDKDFSSNIVNERCIFSNAGIVKEEKSQTKTSLLISRILSEIGSEYKKHY